MLLNKDFVSRVVNNLKALNKDSHISRRFILKTGKTKARFLIAQKMDELSMSREFGLITPIECFELEQISNKDCGIVEFKLCKDLMKSVHKLPELLYSKTGVSVFRVYNIANDYTYDYITPSEYARRNKKRTVIPNKKFFTVVDEHLYLLNSTSELVDLEVLSMDKEKSKSLSSCNATNLCISEWDKEFVCPDRFLDIVVKDTLQELASIQRTSVEDENPNLDNNQKSQTVQ